MVTEDMILAINAEEENKGTETRYWKNGNRYFVCYNAVSDMDDIHEVSADTIRNIYYKK